MMDTKKRLLMLAGLMDAYNAGLISLGTYYALWHEIVGRGFYCDR